MKKTLLRLTAFLSLLLLTTGFNSKTASRNLHNSHYVVSASDPLPSWNEGDLKQKLIDYVTNAIKEGSAGFVPAGDRIAVFDNDGTLWSEQPLYFQFFFAFDRAKQLAPQHPEWNNKEPFKSALSGNIKGVFASGNEGVGDLMAATFTGTSGDAFDKLVKAWIDTARHPFTKKAYNEMVFQPMLELLNYLRANGFKTFIVSGGDLAFMRAWVEKTYNIPPEQVVGSWFNVKYDSMGIMRLPELGFMDDGPGKPEGIYQHIGKKPVFAAGNSDGDYQMLQWTSTNTEPHMEIIVHHTDSVREWAYDRRSSIGRLEKGLDDAPKYNWLLVDMKKDWKQIYP